MFENRVLKRVFGPKRDVVTGEWRKLHKKELTILYSPNIIRAIKSRRIRCAGHVAHVGNIINVYKGMVRRPQRKIKLGRPRHRWDNNIKVDLKEVGREHGLD